MRQNSKPLKPLKLWLFRLAVFLVSILIGVLLCEILLRIFWPQDLTGTWFEDSRQGANINKANWVARHQIGRRIVYYHLNQFHLRGNWIGDCTNRVLCLGDSFTFGWLLEDKDTYVSKLNEFAKRDFTPKTFEFLNGGVSGGGTADFVDFVEDFGPQIHPSVLLVFLNNDDTQRSVNSGLFRLDASGTVVPVNQHYLGGRFRDNIRRSATYQWLLEHSELVQLVRTSLGKRVVAAHLQEMVAHQTAREVEADVRLEKALFLRLRDWSETNNCRLIVTTTGFNSFTNFPLGWADGSANRAFFNQSADFFSDSKIPFHDIGPDMLASTRGDFGPLIISNDFHPNEKGDALIANLAWPWIREELNAMGKTSQ